jgi:chemotaxis protein methyltransferase CheR
MHSFGQYYDYVCSTKGRREELIRMIDVVSTNKTDFFREPSHFDFLRNRLLPHCVNSKNYNVRKKIHIWSAGCSSGEEPYTLAMVLSDFFNGRINKDQVNAKPTARPIFNSAVQSPDPFAILGTDISTRMLATAKKAIYPKKTIEPVPPMMKRKYLMRGKGFQKDFCRIVPELRSCVNFQRLNLTDRDFGMRIPMDIIFCRNVIIYFDRQTQIALFEKFYDQLVPGGHLFIGHSESLHGINDRFETVVTTIYRKPERRSP